jgi:hypothetical protein
MPTYRHIRIYLCVLGLIVAKIPISIIISVRTPIRLSDFWLDEQPDEVYDDDLLPYTMDPMMVFAFI